MNKIDLLDVDNETSRKDLVKILEAEQFNKNIRVQFTSIHEGETIEIGIAWIYKEML